MHRQALAILTVLALGAGGGPAFAADTQILLFNLVPGASYQVRRNGATGVTRAAGDAGNLAYQSNTSPGDVFEFLSGSDAQGPTPPTHVGATETSFGCVTVTWTRSSDPAVTGYRAYFGTRPRTQAAYTDSIEAANGTSANRCGLTAGNYYFSVRAYNASGEMSAYAREVLVNVRGTDAVAPSISQLAPASGATGVPLNAVIYFVTSDDKTGVDASGIVITVEGTARGFTTSSTAGGLAVQCDPAGNLPADTDIDVSISVPDRAAPANVATRTYRFHTGTAAVEDIDAPVLSAVAPARGASNVDTRPTIEVRVRDAGVGVDLASIRMEVNGGAVEFTVAGDPSDLRVRYRPASAFSANSTIDVRVLACDRASPANCASELAYQFSVGSAQALADARGAIVPDGFWAGDPVRPLEVRDLPRNWSVRIFDTSGAAVRHHDNPTDGASWSWNFRNDNGQAVAPALYLVRVTDAEGAVQRSGRFLVQSRQ